MALPKRKTSKSNKRVRRSHLALSEPELVRCSQCNSYKKPHYVCPVCGTYNGRQVLEIEAKIKKQIQKEQKGKEQGEK